MTAEIIPFRGVTPQASGGRTLYCESRAQHKQKALNNFYTALRHEHVDPCTAYDRMTAFGDDYDRLTESIAEAMAEKECG
jgi:hypothetical protein